jgi:protein TonB
MSAAMYAGGRGQGEQGRVFKYAVLGSILLHALLLSLLPGLRQSNGPALAPPGPIVARLALARTAPPQPVPPAPPPVAEPPPQVAPAEPPPAPAARPVLRPKPAPLAKAAPAPVKSSPPPPSAPATATAPVPPPSAPAPATSTLAKTAPQSAPSAPPAQAPSEAADAGTLAQYRLQLISVAKRYKRYPRVAMDNNWEGTAEIRLVIGANGFIASLIVKKGTGHEVLDQEALQWIRKAKPLAPIPAALRGKEFTVDIPVIFNLKEPDA